jgi:hypothetical protein
VPASAWVGLVGVVAGALLVAILLRHSEPEPEEA